MSFRCKDCQERHPGCWSDCESYKAEKQKRECIKQQQREEGAWYDYKFQRKNYKKPF